MSMIVYFFYRVFNWPIGDIGGLVWLDVGQLDEVELVVVMSRDFAARFAAHR